MSSVAGAREHNRRAAVAGAVTADIAVPVAAASAFADVVVIVAARLLLRCVFAGML